MSKPNFSLVLVYIEESVLCEVGEHEFRFESDSSYLKDGNVLLSVLRVYPSEFGDQIL